MEITFWGVRGSIAAPGPEFNRYGGNTPCVAVTTAQGARIILDAGTGIIGLGRELLAGELGQGAGEAVLLLTHPHWDHIQGFPFFAPAFVPGNRITVYGSSASPRILEGLLEGQMSSPYSPLQSLHNMGATIRFEVVEEGHAYEVGGVTITAQSNQHGHCLALAYRLQEGDRSLIYAPDASYGGGVSPRVCRLYQGADVLIHDCTYTPEDKQLRISRGQSSVEDAARVATNCGTRTLVMFHYDQDYTDDEVDALRARCRELLDARPGGDQVELVAAREGQTLTL